MRISRSGEDQKIRSEDQVKQFFPFELAVERWILLLDEDRFLEAESAGISVSRKNRDVKITIALAFVTEDG